MDLKAIERSIAAHTNRERRKRGLRRVQPKRNMNAAARSHSQQMAKVGKFGTRRYRGWHTGKQSARIPVW